MAPVIELKKHTKILKKVKFKKAKAPAVTILFVLGLLAYYIFSDSGPPGDLIHLIGPRRNQPTLSPEKASVILQRALTDFVQDNFSTYQRSQEELVRVLEGDPKNAGAIALLCLNYLELWPYAFQDTRDVSTVNSVLIMASQIDPAGIEAATCRVVDLLVRDRVVEARGVTEMVLDTYGGTGKPPTAFYYFKARIFDIGKDYTSASSYLRSAQQLWPQWIRLFSYDGEILARLRDYTTAVNRFRAVLKANPNHQVARIELGIIEALRFNNVETGKSILMAAMRTSEKAPRSVAARGFLALAEVALREGRRSEALKYAQRAYSNNSQDARVKEIILQLGGDGVLRATKISDMQLVYEGDQLVRENDHNGAQALYKAAFEANKKNGIAAMKAAQSLWELSLSSDAIDWLNRATRADPDLIDAYVLLADYYSQRFNYSSAGEVLNRARRQAPKSYKVYKGYAMIELRRYNYRGSVSYAEKAIALYEADVESYIFLAQALLNKNEPAKAFEVASKAIEIDLNSRQAQVVYAEALAATRGVPVGLDYLNRLASTYPTITEFRLALGRMYLRDQQYTSAQTVIEQVIKIDDKPKKAYQELAKTLQAQQKYEDALAAYMKAAALDPSDVEPLFLAGQLYLEYKKPSDARQQFQRVLRINKDYPLVNYYIGRSALQLESYQEALEQSKLEKAKNPNLADPYILAADAYTEMKQYSLCAGEYQQAVKLRPAGSDIFVKMARCYRMSGNLDAAISMINQASYLESGNPEVWKEQGAIYEMRAEAIKAIEAYQQYLVLAPNALDREQVQVRIKALSQ